MNPEESEPISKTPPPPTPGHANGSGEKSNPAQDNMPPMAAELIDDIEAYQRRIEQEWETAKSVYQSRISEIMDDVLKKNVDEVPPKADRTKSKGPRDQENVEDVVSRVAKELRAMDARARRIASAQPPLLPGPATKKSYWKSILLAVLLAGTAVSIFLYLKMPEYTSLPYARTGAIAVVENKIYIADWFRKTLYVHEAKRGAPIQSIGSLPSGLISGLEPGAKYLWVIDQLNRQIIKHASTNDHRILEKYPAPDDRPTAMTLERNNLWIAGMDSQTLFRLRADDPTEILDRYDLPFDNVTAFQFRDKRLWILDGRLREITVCRLQKPLKPLATFDLDPFLKGSTPTGMAMSKKYVWVVTENPAAIVKVSLSNLKKSKSTDF